MNKYFQFKVAKKRGNEGVSPQYQFVIGAKLINLQPSTQVMLIVHQSSLSQTLLSATHENYVRSIFIDYPCFLLPTQVVSSLWQILVLHLDMNSVFLVEQLRVVPHDSILLQIELILCTHCSVDGSCLPCYCRKIIAFYVFAPYLHLCMLTFVCVYIYSYNLHYSIVCFELT